MFNSFILFWPEQKCFSTAFRQTSEGMDSTVSSRYSIRPNFDDGDGDGDGDGDKKKTLSY